MHLANWLAEINPMTDQMTMKAGSLMVTHQQPLNAGVKLTDVGWTTDKCD